jgi:hypothetical protein
MQLILGGLKIEIINNGWWGMWGCETLLEWSHICRCVIQGYYNIVCGHFNFIIRGLAF